MFFKAHSKNSELSTLKFNYTPIKINDKPQHLHVYLRDDGYELAHEHD